MSELKKCKKCGKEIYEEEYFTDDGDIYFHERCLIKSGFVEKTSMFLVKGKQAFTRRNYNNNQLVAIACEMFKKKDFKQRLSEEYDK